MSVGEVAGVSSARRIVEAAAARRAVEPERRTELGLLALHRVVEEVRQRRPGMGYMSPEEFSAMMRANLARRREVIARAHEAAILAAFDALEADEATTGDIARVYRAIPLTEAHLQHVGLRMVRNYLRGLVKRGVLREKREYRGKYGVTSTYARTGTSA